LKIKVKLNITGKKISSIIEDILVASKLPSCLGNMCPPLVMNEILDEDTEYLGFSFNIDPDDKSDVKPDVITNSVEHLNINKFAVKKSGIKRLEEIKNDMIINYTNHVIKCATCKLTDTCFKLSTLYSDNIKTIENI